ncbi:hypothetical protein DFH09DRAFT_1353349 [Mycena vulgaris]|nr:hypothetical protein DFH09DRAFT_1353349 [Mycena vulgaris]
MSIVESCPQEILLEFTRHLEVWDLVNFLATCRLIRGLRLERSLWIAVFIRLRTVHMQPLPIAHIVDLDTFSPDELEYTARRAGRLLQKFRAHQAFEDPPQPVSIREFSVERSYQLECINGTNLAVENDWDGGFRCWNVRSATCVATLALLEFQMTTPACTDVLIGGSIRPSMDIFTWVVVTIDYTDRSNVKISHVVSPPLSPDVPGVSFEQRSWTAKVRIPRHDV